MEDKIDRRFTCIWWSTMHLNDEMYRGYEQIMDKNPIGFRESWLKPINRNERAYKLQADYCLLFPVFNKMQLAAKVRPGVFEIMHNPYQDDPDYKLDMDKRCNEGSPIQCKIPIEIANFRYNTLELTDELMDVLDKTSEKLRHLIRVGDGLEEDED